jgi:predicted SAM-dependent methyltransferase
MGQFLHFGAAQNHLPEPWENLDPSHDIRKRLRFGDGTASGIAAEHVIEHVPFLQGLRFMREALRVLEPGGVLRLAFPDVTRFVHELAFVHGPEPRHWPMEFSLNDRAAAAYAEGLSTRPGAMSWFGNEPLDQLELQRRALELLLTGWGHAMAWTEGSAAGCLLVVGFRSVERRQVGKGALSGIDGHHAQVGAEVAALETSILEATK